MMTIDESTTQLLAMIAAVVALSVAYGKALGGYQYQIVEWVVDAFEVKSRYKGLVNLGVGIVLAACFAFLVAWQSGEWFVMATGILAGVLASVEASKIHDGQVPAEQEKPAPKQTGLVVPETGRR